MMVPVRRIVLMERQYKFPGPGGLEGGRGHVFLSFLVVLFVDCTNEPFQTKPESSASGNQSSLFGVMIFSRCALTGGPKSFSPVSEPIHGSTVAYHHIYTQKKHWQFLCNVGPKIGILLSSVCRRWTVPETVHNVRSLDTVLLVSEKTGRNGFSEAVRQQRHRTGWMGQPRLWTIH
jgi:hypothetical protein